MATLVEYQFRELPQLDEYPLHVLLELHLDS